MTKCKVERGDKVEVLNKKRLVDDKWNVFKGEFDKKEVGDDKW